MAFSVNTPVGDGVTKQFAVNFTNGIFSRDSVSVFVDGELDGGGNQIERDFIWINDGLIELTGDAPASGATINIRRIMDKQAPAVDFEDGEILNERNLDLTNDQLLNLIHELLDGYGYESIQSDIGMNGNLITGLGEALTGDGVPTRDQVLAFINAQAEGLVSRRRETRKIASQGQTVFNLADVIYVPAINNIQVYVNGVAQVSTVDYLETNESTITFLSGLDAGDAVDMYVNEVTEGTYDPVARKDLQNLTRTSVAAMVASSASIGDKVTTSGYYAPGDGGGNDYEIVAGGTGTANGGSFIDLDNGLQAKALFMNGFVTLPQFGAQESGDQSTVIQNWADYLSSSRNIGVLTPHSYEFGSTLNFAGTGINIIASTLSTLRYTGSGDGILFTGTRHKMHFGTVTVDIGASPSSRNIITYRDLNRSQISFDRLGSNSGSAIKYDGPNATANTGDNKWVIHNGETGGSEYCINLSSSPSFGCEGDTFEASSLYPPTQAVVHCGDSVANDTVRYNQFKVALFGSQAGSPFTPRLAEFFNGFNTLYMGAWTEALDEEFFFAPSVTDNYIFTVPGLQRGGRDDIRVVDGGRNYVQRYKNFGDTQVDDTVRQFRPQRQYGILEIYAEKRGLGLITFDFDGEVGSVITSGGSTTFTVQAGALTGTTGPDGSINVGVNAADKNLYIENRSGITRNITYSVRGYL